MEMTATVKETDLRWWVEYFASKVREEEPYKQSWWEYRGKFLGAVQMYCMYFTTTETFDKVWSEFYDLLG